MNASDEERPQISPASPHRAAEVLRLAFSRLPDEDRSPRVEGLLEGLSSDPTGLSGLLEARRGERLVGAILSQVHPGKTALLWPPRLDGGEPATTADQLLKRTVRWLRQNRVRVAHALIETADAEDEAVLRRGGFEPLANLVYLVSLEDDFPQAPPAGPLEFEGYTTANHDRLARLIDATYEQTLDCPKLNGIRHSEDILAGYRASGTFAPDHWWIVRHGRDDVGCLLLAHYPEAGNCELVYMGLVPAARGNGWGRHVAGQAQWLARQAGRARLVLAVDAANTPAIRIYQSLGFRAWDRKGVYLRVFQP